MNWGLSKTKLILAIWNLDNYVYSLSCWELDVKIDVTLVSVKNEAGASSQLA